MNHKRKEALLRIVHVGVDAGDGCVIGGHAIPANIADTTERERPVNELNLSEGPMVFADTVYASKNNKTVPV